MRQNSRISVIVPVYNRETTVKRCIDSLLHQTYKNIEIICVNDGSTDNSFNILCDYQKKDNRVKIINNKKNMGIGYSRSVGLSSASGKYIMWCDSDDWFEKNMCKKMLHALEKFDVDLVECNTKMEFEGKISQFRQHLNKDEFSIDRCGKFEINPETCSEIKCVLWNKIFKKSIIDKYDIKFPPINAHEDSCFLFLYLVVSKTVYRFKDKLYHYAIYSGSTIDKEYDKHAGLIGFFNVKTLGEWVPKTLKEKNLTQAYSLFNEIYFRFLNYTKRSYEDLAYRVMNCTSMECEEVFTNSLFTSQRMNIFFAVDHNYVEHLCVTISSILVNARDFDVFNFYIIDSGLLENDKKKIEELKKYKNFNIEYIKVNMEMFKNYPIKNSYLSLATYAKYLIADLKPEIDRCLYLDCDIVVQKPLIELYDTEFGDNYAVAVKDSFYPSDFAQKYDIKDYFNAGVLLINAKKWREDGVSQKFFETTLELGNIGDLGHEDQDVLNYVLNDKVKFVGEEWNCQCFSFSFNIAKTKQEFFDLVFSPVIIHYTGQAKPWGISSLPAHPYAFKYFEYKKLTPYRKDIKKDLKRIYGLKKF